MLLCEKNKTLHIVTILQGQEDFFVAEIDNFGLIMADSASAYLIGKGFLKQSSDFCRHLRK